MNRRTTFVLTAVILGSAISPVLAVDNGSALPDFSGQWGRDMLFFEPPPSGPGPLQLSPQDRRYRRPAGALLYDRDAGGVAWRSYELDPETRGRASRQEVRRLGRRRYGVAGPAQFVLA